MRVLWKNKNDYGRLRNIAAAGFKFSVDKDGALDPQPSPAVAERLVASKMFVYEGHEDEAPTPEGTLDLPKRIADVLRTDPTPTNTRPGALIAHGPLKDAADTGAEVFRKTMLHRVESAKEFIDAFGAMADPDVPQDSEPQVHAHIPDVGGLNEEDIAAVAELEREAASISLVANLAQAANGADSEDLDAILASEGKRKRR